MNDKQTTKEIIAECEGPFRYRYRSDDCNGREVMRPCDDGCYVLHDDAMERVKSSLRVIVDLTREKYEAQAKLGVVSAEQYETDRKRLRETAQILVAELGGDPPHYADSLARTAVETIRRLRRLESEFAASELRPSAVWQLAEKLEPSMGDICTGDKLTVIGAVLKALVANDYVVAKREWVREEGGGE